MTRWRGATAAALAVLLLLIVAAAGYRSAVSTPVVRRLELALDGYPSAAPPIRLVLFSDLHVHGPDTPPDRIAKIVAQINTLHPDIVIAAGDFVGGNWIGRRYSPAEAVAPLAGLRAVKGIYAVLGNHDAEAGEAKVTTALRAVGVRVLVNDAVSVGPLAIGGIDGQLLQGHARWQARRTQVYAKLLRTPGAKLLVAHRPDEANWTPPWLHLVLAGHTHCGQIVLPVVGALNSGSDFGNRYLCGPIREGQRLTVVTAGVGTSKFPVRIGAPPDLWLIEIHGPATGQH